MKLSDLDKHPTSGNAAIANMARWLRNFVESDGVTWNSGQRCAALQSCNEAEEMLSMIVVYKDGMPSLASAQLPLPLAPEQPRAAPVWPHPAAAHPGQESAATAAAESVLALSKSHLMG